jgi:hypothetical protein
MENKIAPEYDAGMGTTKLMWEYLNERLAETKEKLPYSLNQAIYALCEGRAKLVPNAEASGARSVPLDAPVGRK